VIEFDRTKYSLGQEEEFRKKHQNDLDGIGCALRVADFEMHDREIGGTLKDIRTILISKDFDEECKKTFYPATCEEAMVNRKGEIASREAGEKSS
jgi:hypothetical protein